MSKDDDYCPVCGREYEEYRNTKLCPLCHTEPHTFDDFHIEN